MLDDNVGRRRLRSLLQERSKKVLEGFRNTAISSVEFPKLLSILKDVIGYWNDVYRPTLVSLSCEAVGGNPSTTEDAALAITLMAAGMGIHDDIIDKSKTKHLRTTIVGIYNPEEALLAGDILIIKGLIVASNMLATHKTEENPRIIAALENCIFELYEGEFMEISSRRDLNTTWDYRCQVLWKFNCYTEACGRLGAIIGGGTEEEVEVLSKFGKSLGYIITLGEEIKDSRDFDLNLSNRLKNEGLPLPILHAAQSSTQIFNEIKAIVEKNQIILEDVKRVVEFCLETGAFERVYDLAKKTADEALLNIRALRPSEAQDALTQMLKESLKDVAHYIP